ncbi:putative glycoside hydrolase [Tieghemostelium lacteum]|uniref:Putative glycoside hydrolase n=1 Tax=Tieghemostelium lacteum TaxID=361077 RepID=A0A151ZHN1_TIELA|nr:putative glycoside hydrolase [Tieghemostelium lacteum]|eukprot:KYQ93409.1 putative glycoside hydrolase [Tieghemostelium lacteum]
MVTYNYYDTDNCTGDINGSDSMVLHQCYYGTRYSIIDYFQIPDNSYVEALYDIPCVDSDEDVSHHQPPPSPHWYKNLIQVTLLSLNQCRVLADNNTSVMTCQNTTTTTLYYDPNKQPSRSGTMGSTGTSDSGTASAGIASTTGTSASATSSQYTSGSLSFYPSASSTTTTLTTSTQLDTTGRDDILYQQIQKQQQQQTPSGTSGGFSGSGILPAPSTMGLSTGSDSFSSSQDNGLCPGYLYQKSENTIPQTQCTQYQSKYFYCIQ